MDWEKGVNDYHKMMKEDEEGGWGGRKGGIKGDRYGIQPDRRRRKREAGSR